jgi:hypothetical protein
MQAQTMKAMKEFCSARLIMFEALDARSMPGAPRKARIVPFAFPPRKHAKLREPVLL